MSNLISGPSHHHRSPHTLYNPAPSMSPTPVPHHHQPPPMQGLPTPPPSIGYDVHEFRRFFSFGLSQLKQNNKYIINDLTTLASVYHHRMATCIVKEIEQYILESHPAHRLIGFYALDSICKNLGHPFPELFKASIEHLFLTAYREVEHLNPATKIKFEELLGTWRTGSAAQSELFGPELQRKMEDGIFGSWRHGNEAPNSLAFENGVKQLPAIASPAEKASILFDLRRILADRRDIATHAPTDQANLAQIDTLQQLEQLVATQQLTMSQVEEIRKQLQPLKLAAPPPPPIEQHPAFSTSHHLSQPPNIFEDSDALAQLNHFLEANPNILQQVMQQSHQAQPPQAAVAQPVLDPTFQNVSDILSQFVQPQQTTSLVSEPISQAPLNFNLFDSQHLAAALTALNLPQCNTQQNATPFMREQSHESAQKLSPSPSSSNSDGNCRLRDHPDPAVMEYEDKIAGLSIELQNASINRVKPSEIADLLYSDIPQFCRQDGSRFLPGKIGNQRASDQLDRYFRIQRQVHESGQRAQQRMWAQAESTWLYSQDTDPTGKKAHPRPDGSRSPSTTRRMDEEQEKMAELRRKTVVRPSSSLLASQPCPICLEPFDTKLDEEEDEFFWINAIESFNETKQTTVFYHATCHFETLRNHKKRMQLKAGGLGQPKKASRGLSSVANAPDSNKRLANPRALSLTTTPSESEMDNTNKTQLVQSRDHLAKKENVNRFSLVEFSDQAGLDPDAISRQKIINVDEASSSSISPDRIGSSVLLTASRKRKGPSLSPPRLADHQASLDPSSLETGKKPRLIAA
ncbi:hypothetical protein PGT21_020626 [Puccinia graminis f. sp. tritici]|uniref:CID domain-containing protein n=2 Tax=Puccinia graminis f. sp. tritici TaxID=56615 RepID=A0A5B0MG34_PUCGR|nr:hypothetical protein PGT21_020626 [Puccinia graminis f. sp. tritici]